MHSVLVSAEIRGGGGGEETENWGRRERGGWKKEKKGWKERRGWRREWEEKGGGGRGGGEKKKGVSYVHAHYIYIYFMKYENRLFFIFYFFHKINDCCYTCMSTEWKKEEKWHICNNIKYSKSKTKRAVIKIQLSEHPSPKTCTHAVQISNNFYDSVTFICISDPMFSFNYQNKESYKIHSQNQMSEIVNHISVHPIPTHHSLLLYLNHQQESQFEAKKEKTPKLVKTLPRF